MCLRNSLFACSLLPFESVTGFCLVTATLLDRVARALTVMSDWRVSGENGTNGRLLEGECNGVTSLKDDCGDGRVPFMTRFARISSACCMHVLSCWNERMLLDLILASASNIVRV